MEIVISMLLGGILVSLWVISDKLERIVKTLIVHTVAMMELEEESDEP